MRYFLTFAFVVWGCVGAAEARCHRYAWQSKWGMEMNAYMETDGAVCSTSPSRMGGTSEVHSVNIAAPARHGTASISGRTVLYRPKPGFKGQDQFVFAIIGNKNGSPQRATMRVTVTVR